MKDLTLKARAIIIVLLIFLITVSLTFVAFRITINRIIENQGVRFAIKQAVLDKNRVLSVIHKEVALSLKLAFAFFKRMLLRQIRANAYQITGCGFLSFFKCSHKNSILMLDKYSLLCYISSHETQNAVTYAPGNSEIRQEVLWPDSHDVP